ASVAASTVQSSPGVSSGSSLAAAAASASAAAAAAAASFAAASLASSEESRVDTARLGGSFGGCSRERLIRIDGGCGCGCGGSGGGCGGTGASGSRFCLAAILAVDAELVVEFACQSPATSVGGSDGGTLDAEAFEPDSAAATSSAGSDGFYQITCSHSTRLVSQQSPAGSAGPPVQSCVRQLLGHRLARILPVPEGAQFSIAGAKRRGARQVSQLDEAGRLAGSAAGGGVGGVALQVLVPGEAAVTREGHGGSPDVSAREAQEELPELAMISFHRMLAIRYPLRIRQWLTAKQTARLVTCVSAVVIAYALVIPVCHHWVPPLAAADNQQLADGNSSLGYRCDKEARKFLVYYSHGLFGSILPFFVMVLCTCLIVYFVCQSRNDVVLSTFQELSARQTRLLRTHHFASGPTANSGPSTSGSGGGGGGGLKRRPVIARKRRAPAAGTGGGGGGGGGSEKRVTLMLVLMNATYFLTNGFAGLFLISKVHLTSGSSEFTRLWALLHKFADVCACLNNSTNWVFYLLSGRRFRQQFLHLLGCHSADLANSRARQTNGAASRALPTVREGARLVQQLTERTEVDRLQIRAQVCQLIGVVCQRRRRLVLLDLNLQRLGQAPAARLRHQAERGGGRGEREPGEQQERQRAPQAAEGGQQRAGQDADPRHQRAAPNSDASQIGREDLSGVQVATAVPTRQAVRPGKSLRTATPSKSASLEAERRVRWNEFLLENGNQPAPSSRIWSTLKKLTGRPNADKNVILKFNGKQALSGAETADRLNCQFTRPRLHCSNPQMRVVRRRRSLLDYAAPVWGPIISNSSWTRLQSVQNAAIRGITGCTALTSEADLHSEVQLLTVRQHNRLLSLQFKLRARRPELPCHHLSGLPPPRRLMKASIFTAEHFNADWTPVPAPDVLDAAAWDRARRAQHTQAVQAMLDSLPQNRVIQTQRPAIHRSETCLPRRMRCILAQLRSGFCPLLQDFQSRIKPGVAAAETGQAERPNNAWATSKSQADESAEQARRRLHGGRGELVDEHVAAKTTDAQRDAVVSDGDGEEEKPGDQGASPQARLSEQNSASVEKLVGSLRPFRPLLSRSMRRSTWSASANRPTETSQRGDSLSRKRLSDRTRQQRPEQSSWSCQGAWEAAMVQMAMLSCEICNAKFVTVLRCIEGQRCRGAEVHRCKAAEVQRCRGAEVQRCRGAEVQRCRGAEVQRCRGAEVQRCRGAEVQRCRGAEVQRCRGAEVQRCRGAEVQRCRGAEVQRCRGAEVQRCRGAEVQRCRGAEVQRCRGAEVQRCRGAEVQRCRGAEVQRCRGAEVQRCRGAEVQRCRGAEVQRCRGAEVHGCTYESNFELPLSHLHDPQPTNSISEAPVDEAPNDEAKVVAAGGQSRQEGPVAHQLKSGHRRLREQRLLYLLAQILIRTVDRELDSATCATDSAEDGIQVCQQCSIGQLLLPRSRHAELRPILAVLDLRLDLSVGEQQQAAQLRPPVVQRASAVFVSASRRYAAHRARHPGQVFVAVLGARLVAGPLELHSPPGGRLQLCGRSSRRPELAQVAARPLAQRIGEAVRISSAQHSQAVLHFCARLAHKPERVVLWQVAVVVDSLPARPAAVSLIGQVGHAEPQLRTRGQPLDGAEAVRQLASERRALQVGLAPGEALVGVPEQARVGRYNEPSKEVMEAIVESQRRVNARQKKQREQQEKQNAVDIDEQQYEILVGQLKSAEARNRLRILRARHSQAAERDVGHLIACQPTALRAVRLEAMLPPKAAESAAGRSAGAEADPESVGMSKADRNRLNQLMSG
uniref:G_PROTEIN_RECEP_F1_2 domain-containing protein n=1 Tax=Macrostomum lignano TaxID=282301 RepID=A0A1I8IKN2_9PLAT